MQSCHAQIREGRRRPQLLPHPFPGRTRMAELKTATRAARVLVVDDEPDIRDLLAITLERMGLATLQAAGVREAEVQILEQRPDLCLTDMRMPDGNGLDLVKWIQEHRPEMPVAVITAHGNVES